MNNMKKLTAILLALAMTAGLVLPAAADTPVAAAETTKSVEYVDENGVAKTATAQKIESGSTTGGSNKMWSGGWYYIEGTTTIGGGSINVSGDVKLILCDGATLKALMSYTMPCGIDLGNNASLTIYGQSAQTGKLIASITGDTGTLTINGGVVEAKGDAEISSRGIEVENVIVNGGKVTAIGGEVYNQAAGNSYGIFGDVTFNGGTLIAQTISNFGAKAAFSTAPTLPTTAYCWRTDESSDYNATAYTYSSSHTYVELTTQPSGGGYISYMAWDDTNKKLTPAFIAESECTVVTGSTTDVTWSGGTAESPAWYVVKDDATISGELTVTGDVNLILCDDKTLTAGGSAVGIQVDNGASLTIYSQSNGKNAGALTSTAPTSGIYLINGGSLTINGGKVTGTGTDSSGACGINAGGTVTVNSGSVIATSNGTGKAVLGSISLPAAYWWRTAASGIYKTKIAYTDSALSGTYFEVTTTRPADSLLDRVGYLDWDSSKNKLKTELSYCYDAIEVTGSMTQLGEEGETKWYYVEGNVTVAGKISTFGDVHLILKDGATLTAEGGVVIKDEHPLDEYKSNLTIYGQMAQTGKLVAKGSMGAEMSAGIHNGSYGSLTINGGVIEATGGDATEAQPVIESHGIFGSYITINGGKVTATGGTAAPYGGNNDTASGGISVWKLYINGGSVTATGGTATGASGESYGIQADWEVTGGTAVARSAAGKAVDFPQNATLTLPATYWWRTADTVGTKYKTQNTYADSALFGNYFELTTTRPEVASIDADTPVSYLDWNSTTETLVEMTGDDACMEYVLVKSGDDVTWSAGWYVVSGNVTIDGDVLFDGAVHLILCDGATLSVTGCVESLAEGAWGVLSVYGQSTGDAAGKMTVRGKTFDFDSDGYTWSYALSIDALCVYGGDVTVSGLDVSVEDKNAYSYGVNAYEVTVYGGKLTATGGKAEAEGEDTDASSVGVYAEDAMDIYGGVVKITCGAAVASDDAHSEGIYACGDVTIEGGTVNATGGDATGYYAYSYGICAYYDLIIEGEDTTVSATGGKAIGYYVYSYGIYVDEDMTVTDAEVNATGGKAEAEGEYADAESYAIYVDEYLTIEGEDTVVTAIGGVAEASDDAKSYGIYVYYDLTIEGGEVNATGGKVEAGDDAYSYGIYVEDDMTVTDAEVTAIGGDAEANDDAKSYGIYIYNTDENLEDVTNIKKSTVTAKSGNVIGGDDAYSYGFYNSDGGIYMYKAEVNVTGGNAEVRDDDGDDARSRAIYASDDLTITDSTVTATSGDVDGADDAYSYAIYAGDDLTITDSTVSATSGDAEVSNDEGDDARSRAIYASDDLTITDSTVTATSGDATGADDAYSHAIYADGYMTVEDSTVSATSGKATGEDDGRSYGIYTFYSMTVENSEVTATAGKAESATGDADSQGIYVDDDLTVKSGKVTAIGGDAVAESEDGTAYGYGLWVEESMTIEGGTVIARSNATIGGKAIMVNEVFTLPATYWWRTVPCVVFTANRTAGYANGGNAYAELTADAGVAQAAPRAHAFGEWVEGVPATCRSTGTAGHKDCSACGGHFDANGSEITSLTLPVDPNNHVGAPMPTWDSNAEAHWQYYSCCPSAKTAAAAHAFSDGVCVCGRKQYAVTWSFNGGKLGEQTSRIDKLAAGAAIAAPETPQKAGTAELIYVFDGWYTAAEGGERVTDFGTVGGNVTYYAHWRAQRNEASPNTGDTTAALCLALSLFALTGAALLLCGKKRKAGSR